MKSYINWGIIFIISFLLFSCEEFLEIETPKNKLISEEVFRDEATVKSAMTGIYNQLFLTSFSNGQRNSVTVLAGLSADNLQNIKSTNLERMEFQLNEIQPENPGNLDLWSSAYSMIYLTNSFLEGLEGSEYIDEEIRNQLEGEARFIRAFTYFNLVNLYGEVPLVLSTNYRDNELAARNSKDEVYNLILDDLEVSLALLSTEYTNGERTNVNRYAAAALLARVHLYLENWEMAENYSSEIIQANSTYEILEDMDKVFLANSKEAIWQLDPIGGGGIVSHTNEGSLFIIHPIFSFLASLKLSNDLIDVFDENDKRMTNWIGYHSGKGVYYSYKYKIRNSMDFPSEEYSMVLRIAEQYLIRAEARAQQGKLETAMEDLDIIRLRAGLEAISESNSEINQNDLLDLIIEERRKELFTEWGHRWFDLKRTARINEILGPIKESWETTDVLYPIPNAERMKNPNLSQNPGY